MRDLVLISLLATTTFLGARELTYVDGVDDTLMSISSSYQGFNPVYEHKNLVTTHGFIVYAKLEKLNRVDLVSYYAIGEKTGERPFFTTIDNRQALVFGIFSRKADALYRQHKMEKIGLKDIHTLYMDKPIRRDVFIGRSILHSLTDVYANEMQHMEDSLNQEIAALKGAFEQSVTNDGDGDISLKVIPRHDGVEKRCRPRLIEKPCDCPSPEIKEYVRIPKGATFQVVNRVITKSFLDRFYPQKSASAVRPIIHAKYKEPGGYKKEAKRVSKRATKASPSIEAALDASSNIREAFDIISQNGIISDKDELIVAKRIYRKGDKIGSFTLFDVSHRNGVLVLKSDKTKAIYQGRL